MSDILTVRDFELECHNYTCRVKDVTTCMSCEGQFCAEHTFHFCCTCNTDDNYDDDYLTCMCGEEDIDLG